jgi:hypothetical protein
VERKLLETYNEAVGKLHRNELSDADFVLLIEDDVLPEWRAERERLNALKPVSRSFEQKFTLLLDYMRLRQEAWELLSASYRNSDEEKAKQATAMMNQAEVAVKKLTELKDR